MDNVTESWTEISITVETKDIEIAGSIANMVVPYGTFQVFQGKALWWGGFLFRKQDPAQCGIHVYVNPHENPLEAVSFITERLNSENIVHEIKIADCKTEDWVNNWKQYFHVEFHNYIGNNICNNNVILTAHIV